MHQLDHDRQSKQMRLHCCTGGTILMQNSEQDQHVISKSLSHKFGFGVNSYIFDI